jgi:hypothetical protein
MTPGRAPTSIVEPGRRESGSALLAALVAALLLAAVGVGLVSVSNTERSIAANFGAAHQGRLAADAALERALVDVRRAASLDDLLSGATRSAFADATLTPVAPWGATLDLSAMTTDVQAQSDAEIGWSPNAPRWRLLLWGPLARLAPGGARDPAVYIAAWVGDDLSETDGDPQADTNGIVVLTARALGPFGSRHSMAGTAAAGGGVRLVSVHEVR